MGCVVIIHIFYIWFARGTVGGSYLYDNSIWHRSPFISAVLLQATSYKLRNSSTMSKGPSSCGTLFAGGGDSTRWRFRLASSQASSSSLWIRSISSDLLPLPSRPRFSHSLFAPCLLHFIGLLPKYSKFASSAGSVSASSFHCIPVVFQYLWPAG